MPYEQLPLEAIALTLKGPKKLEETYVRNFAKDLVELYAKLRT